MAALPGAPAMRFLEPGDDAVYPAFVQLMAEAYPILGISGAEKVSAHAQRLAQSVHETGARWVAAERGGTLVGGMRLFDYTMNVRGADALAGGVGSVGVALAHKRQGVARALIRWYLDHYRARAAPFAVLHPFRPDFYRALGFGYGTPVHRYRFAPAALRADGARGTIRLLGAADADAILACSERVRARTNGLIAKHRPVTERTLREAEGLYVGVEDGGVLRGFAQTEVELSAAEVANRNALVVRDLHAEDAAALAALLGYLSAQRDQFREIVMESQDDAFFLAATDPRDGSDRVVAQFAGHRVAETGLGIMYRVLDVERAFAHLPAADAPFALRVEVEDPFHPPTHGGWTFRFDPAGAPQPDAGAVPDATLRIGIADLSSLVVGSLDLPALVRHRLASLEPAAALPRVARAFAVDQRPICNTRF